MGQMTQEDAIKVADDFLKAGELASNKLKHIVELCRIRLLFNCPKNNSDESKAHSCRYLEQDISQEMDSLIRVWTASYNIAKELETCNDGNAERYKRFLEIIREIDPFSKKCGLEALIEECRKCAYRRD